MSHITIIKEIVKFLKTGGYEGIKSRRVETAGGFHFKWTHTINLIICNVVAAFKKKWFYLWYISHTLVGFKNVFGSSLAHGCYQRVGHWNMAIIT